MRKYPLLATVAATALLAGVSIASAQRMDQPGASEKSAPAPKSPGTTGQSPGESKSKDMRPDPPKSGTAPKSGTTGQGEKAEPRAKDTPKSGKAEREERKDAPKPGTADKADPKAPKSGTTGQGEKKTEPGPAQKSTQPGGARPDATASLTVEQRTRIRQTVLASGNVPRVGRVDFSIRVGTVVPRSVRIVALPAPVVEIHPAWRGYLYFVHDDEIVVVEPGTMRIVAVLPA